MPFKSYLIQQYEHTHENAFFRKVVKELRNIFQNSNGLNVLIGNISCNGHQIDIYFQWENYCIRF